MTWSISTTNGYVNSITKLADAASLAARWPLDSDFICTKGQPRQGPANNITYDVSAPNMHMHAKKAGNYKCFGIKVRETAPASRSYACLAHIKFYIVMKVFTII